MDGGESVDARAVARLCTDCGEQMQVVAELLLLRDNVEPTAAEPVQVGSAHSAVSSATSSYGKCRDVIVASTKQVAILAHNIRESLKSNDLEQVFDIAAQLTEVVISLMESATQAAYLIGVSDTSSVPAVPGLMDYYRMMRAKQGIEAASRKFTANYGVMDETEVMRISSNIATNLALVNQACDVAVKRTSTSPSTGPAQQVTSPALAGGGGGGGKAIRRQLSACTKAIQGTTAALLAAIKTLAETGQGSDRAKCGLFMRPLLATVQALLDYTSSPEFAGKAAKLTAAARAAQKDILANAMKVVSAAIQLMKGAGKTLLLLHLPETGSAGQQPQQQQQQQEVAVEMRHVQACCAALSEASRTLSAAMRKNTPGRQGDGKQ